MPADEEPEEPEEQKPKKVESWRKKFIIPDYRKVKIGEYYNDQDAPEPPSDGSTRSSFESDTSSNSDEPKTAASTSIVCAGCNYTWLPGSSSQSQTEPHLSSYELAKLQNRLSSSGRLRIDTHRKEVHPSQFRCSWPGCTVIFCSVCKDIMKVPISAGGAGGSLVALHDVWEKRKSADANPVPAKGKKADGAMTADIVQAVTSSAGSPAAVKLDARDVSETITLVGKAMASVDDRVVEKAVAELMSSHQEELCEKLEAAAATQKDMGSSAMSELSEDVHGRGLAMC